MKIDVYCTECQKKYSIDSQHEGRKVKCKSCGASFVTQSVAGIETAEIIGADTSRAPAPPVTKTRTAVPAVSSSVAPANPPRSPFTMASGGITFPLLSTSLLQDPTGATLHGKLKLSHVAKMYPKRKPTAMPAFATAGEMSPAGSGNSNYMNDTSYPVIQQPSSAGGDPMAAAIGYGILAVGLLGLVVTRFVPLLLILGWFQAPLFALLVIVGCCFVMLGHSHQWARGMMITGLPGFLALVVLAVSAFSFVGGLGPRSSLGYRGPSLDPDYPSSRTPFGGRPMPSSSRPSRPDTSRPRGFPVDKQSADARYLQPTFPEPENNTAPGETQSSAPANGAREQMAEILNKMNEDAIFNKEDVEELRGTGFLPPSFPDPKTQTPKPNDQQPGNPPGVERNPFETNSGKQKKNADRNDSFDQPSTFSNPIRDMADADAALSEGLLRFQSRNGFMKAFHESQLINQKLSFDCQRELGGFAFDRELAGWVGPGTDPWKRSSIKAVKVPFEPIVGVKIVADVSGDHLTVVVPCYEADSALTFQTPDGYVITGFRSTVEKYVTAIQFVCHRQTEQGVDLTDAVSSDWFGTPTGDPVLSGGQLPVVGFWIDSSAVGLNSLGIFHKPK